TDMGKGGGIPDDGASDLVGESKKGGGLRGGAKDNTCEGGDSGSDGESSGGSGGEGLWGSGEDHGESGDDGRVDIARSLAIEILAVTRYAGCGGGVAAESLVSNGFVSSEDGA
ncbi:hypothetical protein Tco_0433787, partial [Tanacetum coccineum]